ncbi:hypothetical protein F2Q70_00001194 [Brassica cretica]|uniref:Uncharacterized protein n=1 Tax=Brassica cretica TaxID=69181 RepID=A0A8S9IZF1_BRACR|nr:hypothetical protein F2Q70_00001194 [Brassica cretica]
MESLALGYVSNSRFRVERCSIASLQVRDSVYGLCISKGSSRRVLRFAISIIIISAISGADKLSSSTSSSSRSTLEALFDATCRLIGAFFESSNFYIGPILVSNSSDNAFSSEDMMKPTKKTNKIVTNKKTPPSKEFKNMMKLTKKPAEPIAKPSPGFSTPRVYQPASKTTSLSTFQSSVKKENVSSLLRNKQTAPDSKVIAYVYSLGPSASDPTSLTSTTKSLIMERMGDKEIIISTDQLPKHQNPEKATSIPSRQKENGRPTKSSHLEKRSAIRSSSNGLKSNNTSENKQEELSKSGATAVEKTRLQKNSKAGVIDAKTRRDSLNPKAKPMQGGLPAATSAPCQKVESCGRDVCPPSQNFAFHLKMKFVCISANSFNELPATPMIISRMALLWLGDTILTLRFHPAASLTDHTYRVVFLYVGASRLFSGSVENSINNNQLAFGYAATDLDVRSFQGS